MKKAFTYIFVVGFFATLWQSPLVAWSWFKKQPKTAQQLQADLEKQQINDPTNPYVNYNLGVAAYKNGEYAAAEKNFALAIAHAIDPQLKEHSYFNAGNALYKAALAALGAKWKTSKVEDAVLDSAIDLVSQAITRYESVLVLKADHERAVANKTICEELLRELHEKKRWQHEKRLDKKDEQSSDKDKKGGSDGDKNQQQQGDKGDSGEGSSGDEKTGQDSSDDGDGKKNKNKKGKSGKRDQDSQRDKDSDVAPESEKGSEEKNEQDDGLEKADQADKNSKEQQEKEGQKLSGQQGNDADDAAQQAAAEQQRADAAAAEKEKEAQEERAIGESLRGEESEEKGAEMQEAQSEPQQNSALQKSYKVLLDRLDDQEASKQKGRLQQKSKGSGIGAPRNSQQKPW